MLTSQGFLLSKNDYDKTFMRKMKKHFTISTRTIGNMYVSNCQFRQNQGYLILPRFGFRDIITNTRLKNKMGLSNFKFVNSSMDDR